MTALKNRPIIRTDNFLHHQRGITGLETAIVLIAFVVVASVFAFAVLNTGFLSSEKSKEAALGGLQETSSTLSLRGEVIADSNAAKTAVDLSTTGSVIIYLDDFQGINCQNPQSFDGDPDTAECSWSSEWLIGSGEIVDPGEQVEITVTLTNLTPLLAAKQEFTIQIKPNKGAVVIVTRTLPGELQGIMDVK